MIRSLALALLLVASGAAAQTYDQDVLGALLDRPGWVPEAPIPYAVYRVQHESGNSIRARHELYHVVGEGDVERGRQRLAIAQLFGYPPAGELRLGDELVLPARPRDFDLGALAFAPYPPIWTGASGVEKVVLVDKTSQTWAAYASGHLVRWGPASTGAARTPTPTGRFTMNWREMERESTEAPPGETWLMRYVMNIHARRGIHLHQYDVVPSGPPEGHGCVRMVEADARWLWAWSDAATRSRAGTTVIVQGSEPAGTPLRFVDGPDGPRRALVALPADPMRVPRGDR